MLNKKLNDSIAIPTDIIDYIIASIIHEWNLLLKNFKYFPYKEDRPFIAESKWEGMPCTFENKLFANNSIWNILKYFLKMENKQIKRENVSILIFVITN